MNIIEKMSCKRFILLLINSLCAFSIADTIEQAKKASAMGISFGLPLAMHLVRCELFFICSTRPKKFWITQFLTFLPIYFVSSNSSSVVLLQSAFVGLLLTYIALYLMDGQGQPALLYLVPCTLGSELISATCRTFFCIYAHITCYLFKFSSASLLFPAVVLNRAIEA